MNKVLLGGLLLILLIFASCDVDKIAPTALVTVQNNSSLTVIAFFATYSTNTSWGANLLGSDTILPGDNNEFVVPAGVIDWLAQDASGSWSEYGIQYIANQSYIITLVN